MRKPIATRYYEIVNKEKYLKWQTEILKKIYDDFNMLDLFGKEYPVICFPAAHKKEGGIENITTSYDLLTDMEVFDTKKTLCRNFSEIVEPRIQTRNELEFMFKKAKINEQGELEWFSTKVGTYEQNLYTTGILEYELYRYYRTTRGEVPNLSGEDILKQLPLRQEIHNFSNQFDIVTHGLNRNGAISIQLFYTFIDVKQNAYVVPVKKLSDTVANKQFRYQIVPEGGYRLHNDKIVDNEKLFINYNLKKVCMRQILENLYGHENIKADDKLVYNPRENEIVNYLMNRIDNKKAYFEMLGLTMDLVTLRPTLSFILRIDDENFPYTELVNKEGEEKIEIIKIKDLPKSFFELSVTNESAGMYDLLTKNKIFKNIEI
ncbi:MAG: hypothetical protein RSC93_03185 [Erysipelotrichaceae bacterium]